MQQPDEGQNPYESPLAANTADASDTVAVGRRRRTPQARDFDAIALQLKFVGWLVTLLALPAILANPWGLGGLGSLGVGLGFLVVGYGLGWYKIWAWYAGVVLMLPLTTAVTLGALMMVGVGGIYILYLLLPPAFAAYVTWVLLSKGGRTRYRQTAEAIARAKANPDSIAGRLYRKR